ncbi:uncharacterized protein LOC118439070 [Folsomia candida]|uniref:uncharacterized protein LOC118439070 n=1 Tax=Folsomia candida TaxID=158441 RepID=UPI00160550AA|nr:uncharacterized protein LOC118439070 [Folsomia candida]
MKTSLYFSLFLVYFARLPGTYSRVACPLEWVPSQNGESPEGGVIAFSSDEIVARLNISGLLVPARLSPEDGMAYGTLPLDETVHTSNVYDVLTNPSSSCLVTWVDNNDELATNGQQVQVTDSLMIGRTHMVDKDGNFNTVGGTVSEGQLFVAFQSKQEISLDFQILTSVYPFLSGYLYNFTLHTGHLTPNHVEVIDQETIFHSGFETSQEINHFGTIQEIYQISESPFGWNGINKLTTIFTPGKTPDTFLIENGNNFNLEYTQTREISFKKIIELGPTNQNGVLICSGVNMFQGEVEYEALGRFEGENLSGDEVAKILQASGRAVLNVNGKDAVVKISGVINGKFYSGKVSAISQYEVGQTCEQILKNI